MTLFDYRDPLYGFISIDDLEQEIVDQEAFQRLRRISQLGPTNLVYPSANHTRFEHSLGTLQASTEMFDRLVRSDENRAILGWRKEEEQEGRKLIRLAALLHDIGHAPFSHATEELFPDGKLHEDYTYQIITETEISTEIDRVMGSGASIRVAEIATTQPKTAMDSFLTELLTKDIGTDRIDYLARDSHHLGVAYGKFDVHRLLNTLFIRDNPESGPELAIREGGVHSVEGFLLARYFMFVDVYFHRTRRILDIHLSEFLKEWLNDNVYPTDVSQFLKLDDIHVIRDMLLAETDLSSRFLKRTFFKNAFETVDHPTSAEIVAFRWLSSDVLTKFGEENIRIDEAEKDPYKFGQPPIFVSTRSGFKSLIEHSPLTRDLRMINKKRIYSNEALREEVRQFCDSNWHDKLAGVPIQN